MTDGFDSRPTLGAIRRTNGIAGQISYSVAVTYPGEATRMVSFVGSTYGGSVVMVSADNPDGLRVMDSGRFGEFSPEWVRGFFA